MASLNSLATDVIIGVIHKEQILGDKQLEAFGPSIVSKESPEFLVILHLVVFTIFQKTLLV